MGRGSIFSIAWDRFFGTWDRTIASLSLGFGIVSTLLTLFFIRYPQPLPLFIVIRDLFTLFSLIALILFLLVKFLSRGVDLEIAIKRRDQSKQHLSNQFQYTHNVVHNYRDELFKKYITSQLTSTLTSDEISLLRTVCSHITKGTKESLIEYFKSREIEIGNDISLSVKLLVKAQDLHGVLGRLTPYQQQLIAHSGNTEWVITFFRDYETYTTHRSEREVTEWLYDIKSNTAFQHVIQNKEDHYLNNDLQNDEHYRNENRNWRNFYNSTLVVPIRYRNARDDHYVLYGLLTVDSLNPTKIPNLYNALECKYIMGHAADLLATFFLSLALSRHNSTQPTSSSSVGSGLSTP
jgi:hypothetical protein